MPAKVVVRNLSKRYGGVEAVREVSFGIEQGEIFGLLGPNGAGKTTTLECVIGLREPDAGEIEVCGFDARRQSGEVKQRIGVALQSTALPEQVTPREALRLFGSFYRERVDTEVLLERFGLQEKAGARFVTLSGGQRQRLALALAFVNRPELVILDEPTSGLDPQARRALHDDILRLRQDGCTVLLTTHYLDEAERLCDRVAIIDQGRILAIGAPGELRTQNDADAHTVRLVTSRPLPVGRVVALPGVQGLAGEETRVQFRTTDATNTLAALLALLAEERIDVVDLQVARGSLEEFFLGLTREESIDGTRDGKAPGGGA